MAEHNLEMNIRANGKHAKAEIDDVKKSIKDLGYEIQSLQKKSKLVTTGSGADKTVKEVSTITATYSNGVKKITETYDEAGRVIKSTATQNKKAWDTGKLLWYFNMLRMVANKFTSILTSATDFNETIEKFNVSMGTSAEKAQLFQDKMANAIGTSRAELMNYQANFKNIMAGLGTISTETAEKISESLTKMSLDYSSLFNTSQSSAANKIQAALTGAIMPIRRESGYDVSKNAVSQKAKSLGLEQTYSQLTETEKRLIRIMLLMDQMKNTGAFNDLARTIESPANQIKVLKNQLQELGVWLGNVFMGTIGAILPYINGFIMALKEIVKLFAFFVGYSPIATDVTEPLEEAADYADDVGGGVGRAAKAAKELRKQLQGFDVLNVIQTPTQSSGGGGGGGSTGVDPALLSALQEYDSLMEKVRMKATDIKDAIMEWLGFFSDDGGLTWHLGEGETRLSRILDILKTIGAVLLGYKISKSVLNFINTLTGGTMTTGDIKMKAAGISLMVGGLTLMYNGISHTIENGELTPWNLLQILSGGAMTLVGGMMTFGKGIKIDTLASLALSIAGLTLMYSGVKHTMDDGFTQEALWEIIGGGALTLAGGILTFTHKLGLGLGVSITITAVLAALGTAFAAITNEIEKGKKKVHEQWDSIFTGLGGWSETLNTASSYLSGFNSTLFTTNEEQSKLASNMEDTQTKITEICQTAHDERRDLTDEEIKKLDEYFKKLDELVNKELEIQSKISDAIVQQAQTAAETFEGSAEDFKNIGAKWVKTAEEQASKEVEIAETRATQRIALLNQEYDTEDKRRTQEYKDAYDAAIKDRDEAITTAQDKVKKVNGIFQQGYSDRVQQDTDFAEKYKKYVEGITKNQEDYENDVEHILADLSQSTSEWVSHETKALENYTKANENTFNSTIGTMTDAEKESTGIWLDWLMDTEAKGGDVTDKDKEIADDMIEAFKHMPSEMKTQAQQSLQGMLDGMKAREPDLYNKATNMANSILNKLKKAFDIHSPSKKTRKIFTQVMQGMELGIEDEENNLYKQTNDIADNVMDGLEPKGNSGLSEYIQNALDNKDANSIGYLFGQNIAAGINEGIEEKVIATLAPFTAAANITTSAFARAGLPEIGKLYGTGNSLTSQVGNQSTGFGNDITQSISASVASALAGAMSGQGGSYQLYIDGEQITDVVQKRMSRNANIYGR